MERGGGIENEEKIGQFGSGDRQAVGLEREGATVVESRVRWEGREDDKGTG